LWENFGGGVNSILERVEAVVIGGRVVEDAIDKAVVDSLIVEG
jgi:hypothetical protein